ncbi:MerR family transcriptional regulator [Flindersiella endophytica]
MNGDAPYSIGDLARRTGLSVKTIRFYSDQGLVPPTDRSPAGYRRYDTAALARLELVRTLRDLGLDLPTIRRVVERQASLVDVAAAHADALAVRIRVLRLRHAVLSVVARLGSTPEEIERMHQLARLSEGERQELIKEFLDAAFGGLPAERGFDGVRRTMTPELPENATPAQVEAWIELAELTRDEGFRSALRLVAEQHVAETASGRLQPDIVAVVRDQAGPAVAAGIDPASTEARPVVDALVTRYAPHGDRSRLLYRLETANDHRRERYSELLAVINDWPAPEPQVPALDWAIRALKLTAVDL